MSAEKRTADQGPPTEGTAMLRDEPKSLASQQDGGGGGEGMDQGANPSMEQIYARIMAAKASMVSRAEVPALPHSLPVRTATTGLGSCTSRTCSAPRGAGRRRANGNRLSAWDWAT